MSLGFQDNVGNILGANTADNLYDSSSVGADADGSIIERVEYLQSLVSALSAGSNILQGAQETASSTTSVKISGLAGFGDDFFNTHWYMQVLHNNNSAGNAPEHQVRQITDYASSTGTFTCTAFGAAVETDDLCVVLHESWVAIGRDDDDNVIATTNVTANADGSVLERLEYIQTALATVDDYVDTEVAAIKAVTDAMPDAGALTAMTAAVQAVYDRIAGQDSSTNVLGADDADNGFASTNVVANNDGSVLERLEGLLVAITTVDDYVDTEVAAIKTMTDKIGTVTNTAGTATIGAILGDAANSDFVTRFGNVQTEVDKIGTISNAGGTATIGGAIGPVANNTIVARLETIDALFDVPTEDLATDATINQVVGKKSDTVAGTSLVAIGKQILAAVDAVDNYVDTEIGSADSTTTESLNGKIGTDTELADRSLYDILNGGGPAAAASAAAPANDKSLYAVASAIYNLVVPAAATGETVIDEGDYDWTTAYPAILAIAPAAGAPLSDVTVHLDLDKDTTGFADVAGAETLSVYVERKIDGTNWRRETVVEAALAGSASDNRAYDIDIGSIGVTQQARITAVLSAEISGSAEITIPYVVYYKGLAAPVITPLTATA